MSNYNDPNQKLYGWYSEKQAQFWTDRGSRLTPVVYTTPENTETVVTEVTRQDQSQPVDRSKLSNFDDFVFIGEVVRFIRAI